MIPDVEEILRGLQLIVEPGTVTELRAPDTAKRTVSGYFDDPNVMAQCAASVTDAPAVYLVLNPIKSDLLARANNRIKVYAKYTTADADILRRRWLLFDFDPRRPAGISATDREHASALTRAVDCRNYLCGMGWPEPVMADSGNGAHLLFRIDLANDQSAETLLKHVLQSVAARFDDGQVELDRAVYNAARVTKLYGSYAQKGDPTADRPHRKSAILWNGQTTFEVVAREQLEAVANAAAPAVTPPPTKKMASAENVLELLTQWGLTVVRTEDHQGETEAGWRRDKKQTKVRGTNRVVRFYTRPLDKLGERKLGEE